MALVLLSACGPVYEVDCTTLGGMELVGPLPLKPGGETRRWWTCTAFQEVTDYTFYAFTLVKNDPRFVFLGPQLHGWRVYVNNTADWPTPWGYNVSGITDCPNKIIYVGASPPFHSALAHEMAHGIQNCAPLPPIDEADPDHSHWAEDRIECNDPDCATQVVEDFDP